MSVAEVSGAAPSPAGALLLTEQPAKGIKMQSAADIIFNLFI
jgi:hypothetical protein